MPMIWLNHEPDKDSQMRLPDASQPNQPGETAKMGSQTWRLGSGSAYQDFWARREVIASNRFAPESRRSSSKIGRNHRCPSLKPMRSRP